MRPLVTVITVNYNSSRIGEIASKSIKSILSLDYSPFEVIIVDNGSTDGSFESLGTVVKTFAPTDIQVRFLRLPENYGFAAANTIAFAQRSEEAKYVALINNDLAPDPNSLKKLVEFLEENNKVGGVQGKILTWDGDRIDSAGYYHTQYGNMYGIGQTLPMNSCNSVTFVGYVDGAFSVYRTESILKCGGLFLPYFFMYGDDYELGIRLWRSGYSLLYVPAIAGRHYRSATSKELVENSSLEYWTWRSDLSVMTMYDNLWLIHILFRTPMILLAALLKHNRSIVRGFVDGVHMGLRLRANAKAFRLSRLREPRLKINILRWYSHLIKLFILYGAKASAISYSLISKSLAYENRRSEGVVT